MNLQLTLRLVLLLGSSDVWLISSSVHFVDEGENVTLTSRFETDIRAQLTWFRQDFSGKVTLVKFFSRSHQIYDRYFVAAPVGSTVTLTVTDTTTADSGRYFTVMRNGVNFEAGTTEDLVVIDKFAVPVMRVFHQSTSERVFLCEVSGAGQGWSEPYWMVDGQKNAVDNETISWFAENGSFSQSITLIPSSGAKTAMCMCWHESTGTRIQSGTQILTTGNVSVETSSVIYSEVGETVFIPCHRDNKRNSTQLNWLRIQPNGSLEIVKTDEKRFMTKHLTGLRILQVEKSDCGRYYCGEQVTYQGFHGNGVVLHVEEPSSMANHDQIGPEALLLTEDINDLDDGFGERRYRLRCVGNRLRSPLVTIKFRSSNGEESEGPTWTSLNNNQYSVQSAYTVRSVWLRDRDEDSEFHEHDRRQEIEDGWKDTTWWCEVQIGKNRTLKSIETILYQEPRPDVCLPELCSAVAVAALCVVFILITQAWTRRQGTNVTEDQSSPVQGLQTDVTYASVTFNQSAGSGRTQRVEPVTNPEDCQQYSVLKFNQ